MNKKLAKIGRVCSCGDMITDKHTQTDRQTDKHAHHNTPLRGTVIMQMRGTWLNVGLMVEIVEVVGDVVGESDGLSHVRAISAL